MPRLKLLYVSKREPWALCVYKYFVGTTTVQQQQSQCTRHLSINLAEVLTTDAP